MKLTQQQYELLQPFDSILLKAANKKYLIRSERDSLPPLMKLYEKITGIKLKSSCSSCGGSIKWLERMGNWYKEYKNQITKK